MFEFVGHKITKPDGYLLDCIPARRLSHFTLKLVFGFVLELPCLGLMFDIIAFLFAEPEWTVLISERRF